MADGVTLVLYCQGLGDCSLIGVPRGDGGVLWVLIDCGMHSAAGRAGAERLSAIVADIRVRTGGHLDVVVGTHEHWDHLSGFHPSAGLFEGFTVREVWFPWTEDPADPAARALDRFKGDAALTLAEAAVRLAGDAAFSAAAAGLDQVLGFSFGLQGERVRDAREALRRLAPVKHLRPGAVLELPGVRVHVLGPPVDTALFRVRDSADETYRFGATPDGPGLPSALATGFAAADARLSPDTDGLSPFDPGAGRSLREALSAKEAALDDPDLAYLSAHYGGPAQTDGPSELRDQQWRRVDLDWMGMGVDLALQLDNRTNNTSLVLAFEIVATGRVLLFAADAQIGNWRSWPEVEFPAAGGRAATTGADLLRRTVFFKVGHHGSRNATRSEGGLELMTSPDLVAFVPTDEKMAQKMGWSDIPAQKLLARLAEKTRGRLILSDAEWVRLGTEPPVSGGAIQGAVRVVAGLCVEMEIG